MDIGDKMARELKSYGANILIEPASRSLLPQLLGESVTVSLANQDALDERELPNIKDIFWRNNIMGFAPELDGELNWQGQRLPVLGTFFDQPIAVPDEPDYHTGQRSISPYWQVQGAWPQDAQPQLLAGQALASRLHWQVGEQLTLAGPAGSHAFTLVGLLHSGGKEDEQLLLPLAFAQQLLGRPQQVDRA